MTQRAPSPRRKVAAVVGSAGDDEHLYEIARTLGRHLIDHGLRVASGGLKGVMEAVSRGAHESAAYAPGDTLGILPTYNACDANPWVDVALPTGMHHARNALVVASGDVVIAVGGGAGTLSELSLAWALGRPVIAVESGGWAERLAGSKLDERRDDVVHGPCGPEEAAALAAKLCGQPIRGAAKFRLAESE